MKSNKNLHNIAGWLVFAIAVVVYYFSVERTGSLWDCGEFITGAYKLQVVHPPGAPLFLLVGRMFTLIAEMLSSDPADIAFAVNMLSGVCTAFTATFVCWITIMLGKLSLLGRDGVADDAQNMALAGAGVVAGLTTAFCSSIWFSAVEGEVYAMSTFFTALTLWATVKWYALPKEPQHDRWLVFAIYAAGLSLGVHLLSLLTFPALALFYYFKKYEKHTFLGMGIAAAVGMAFIVFIQKFIIVGIPNLWAFLEIMMVNNFGLPVHSGIIPTLLIVIAVIAGSLYMAHQRQNATLQKVIIAMSLVVVAFSTIGMVVIRANANTPINMNAPSDATRLLPYLNREQYGERPLLYGPDFDAKPVDSKITPRYGLVGDRYEIVDEKIEYVYKSSDKHFFPRMGDYTQNRGQLYQAWMQSWGNKKPTPSIGDNMRFMFSYQFGWMYWRYFMWNFAGRQDGNQGYFKWDVSDGHWASGINFIDEARLHSTDALPDTMRNDKARNRYYMLPFLFGLLGLIFHFQNRKNEALGLLAMFIITGIGIIIYSNQPPHEPRERDYVLVGSFFTYAIWIGLGVLALFRILAERAKLSKPIAAVVATALVMIAPILMGTQNYDDHSRIDHTGSRDYASNFLNSVEENAIIFTYGDNDTYPLWYAQETEGIRTDVRVVNLSLIAVDWYIDQLRRKVNDSEAIEMTIPREAYRGRKRVVTPYFNTRQNPDPNAYDESKDPVMNLQQFVRYIGENHSVGTGSGREYESHMPTKRVFIPVNKQQVFNNGTLTQADTANIVDRIDFKINKSSLIKDDLAILDIIATNAFKRPIYFAITCQPNKMQGLRPYMQLEGLALRIVPVRSKSDKIYSVAGSGRVNVDAVYDNVMNKFKWGNFDKEELYVDRSYMPSVQGHRLTMLRSANALLDQGDKKRGLDLVDKYFEVFPHMNFAYDHNAMYFIDLYVQEKEYARAQPHLEILANETAQHLDFYYSLSDSDFKSFESDAQLTQSVALQILRQVQDFDDETFKAKIDALLGQYGRASQQLQN